MSISGVLVRFFLAYIVLMAIAALVVDFFAISSNSGLNIIILMGAITWSCTTFGTKNGRYFYDTEKTKVVWGMIGINLAIQLVVVGGTALAQKELRAGALLLVVAFVLVVHSVFIYFFVGLVGKLVAKQAAEKAAASARRVVGRPSSR